MIRSLEGVSAPVEREGIATGRPLVAYFVLLVWRVDHSMRQGSEALAPWVQPCLGSC
jgi:hypothetical protein